MSISPAMQEYLAETYRLAHYQKNNPFISTSALADVMGVSAPAVTRMVQRLKEGGYLEHEPYQGISLTATGEREALMNIRKHRLVERFLVDVMKFGWHEVHDSADELGAAVGDEVVNRMEQMSGYPRRCPHGEPIPSVDGVMPEVIDFPLIEADIETDYRISRVNTHDEEILKYLDMLGLLPGTTIHLISRAPFEGPIQLQVNDETHFIGHAIGQILRVCDEADFDLK